MLSVVVETFANRKFIHGNFAIWQLRLKFEKKLKNLYIYVENVHVSIQYLCLYYFTQKYIYVYIISLYMKMNV